jgi:hypothetical protein
MNRFWKRHASWPVWLVLVLALTSGAVVSSGDADDLDPAVWRAIVAQADIAVPAFFQLGDEQ